MRAIRYHDHGGPSVLQLEDVDKPTPDKGEVQIEVRAASVNNLDLLLRNGYEPFRVDLPVVPGADLSGVVSEVGRGVETFSQGDRVIGGGYAANQRGTAEFAVVPESLLSPLPDSVGFEEACGLGHAGATAWHGLVNLAELEPTESLLVHGGSGGVGHIAVQIANRIGAHVIATSSSKHRRDVVKELGADVTLDYTSDRLKSKVLDAAGGSVDVVLDGNLDDYLAFDFEVLGKGGRIIGLEFTEEIDGTANFTEVHARMANWNEARLQFLATPNVPNISDTLQKLTTLVADGDLEVKVARTYDLEETAQAHRDLEDGGFVGKLVIVP